MKKRLLMTALVAIMVAPAAGYAQSLADAARQAEEARRTSTAPPAKLYTLRNADTGTQPTGTATASPAPPVAPRAASATAAGQDERYWKDRMRVLEAQLQDDEMRLAAAIRTRRELQQRPILVTGRDGKGAWCCEGLADAIAAVNYAAAAVASTTAAISRLEDEARIAGVPPGWLRPLQTR